MLSRTTYRLRELYHQRNWSVYPETSVDLSTNALRRRCRGYSFDYSGALCDTLIFLCNRKTYRACGAGILVGTRKLIESYSPLIVDASPSSPAGNSYLELGSSSFTPFGDAGVWSAISCEGVIIGLNTSFMDVSIVSMPLFSMQCFLRFASHALTIWCVPRWTCCSVERIPITSLISQDFLNYSHEAIKIVSSAIFITVHIDLKDFVLISTARGVEDMKLTERHVSVYMVIVYVL